jgi:ribosomal protein S27AE
MKPEKIEYPHEFNENTIIGKYIKEIKNIDKIKEYCSKQWYKEKILDEKTIQKAVDDFIKQIFKENIYLYKNKYYSSSISNDEQYCMTTFEDSNVGTPYYPNEYLSNLFMSIGQFYEENKSKDDYKEILCYKCGNDKFIISHVDYECLGKCSNCGFIYSLYSG